MRTADELPYNVKDAVAYKAATGQEPMHVRPSTAKIVRKLPTEEMEKVAKTNRLFKAIRHLTNLGFTVMHERSSVKEVFLKAADGMEALATNKGEVLIGKNRVTRYLNG
jgi:hypothetical protein